MVFLVVLIVVVLVAFLEHNLVLGIKFIFWFVKEDEYGGFQAFRFHNIWRITVLSGTTIISLKVAFTPSTLVTSSSQYSLLRKEFFPDFTKIS